ncbi:MAG: hypothetical protein JO159_05920 [Acidobacteria bacterium]|nr:hypothetical protein [Acidobacteriota bacterium]
MRKRLRHPRFLLALAAGLLAIAVQSGELGSADTMHRLQTAHSFWTSEPPVFPNEYPEFGAHGRGGKLYDWYGIGQPLLLLPADILGTWLERLPVFEAYRGSDPTVRNIFVTSAINTLLSVLTALIACRLLLALGFDLAQSVYGVLALLFCTTHLHYTQNMMENNYILLLTLAGFCFEYEWLETGSRRALLIGAAAFGLNLLTRLTTAIDLVVGGVFLLLVVWFERTEKRQFQARLAAYLKIAVPVYFFFIFLDRAYQFHRFGSWTDTYVHYFTLEHRRQDPGLPANYPWETPFHAGFLGPLFRPEKSIFLFDPLILLTLLLTIRIWRKLGPAVKAFILSALLLVMAYICFYARYTVWSGDFAWGDRYVSSAVEMAAFVSLPLLLKFRGQLSRALRITGGFLVGASLVIQLASLAFWLPLEIYQIEDLGRPQVVVWMRLKNIAAYALGRMDAWGLNTDAMHYDPWDYEHISTWNFLPFVLRRAGVAPGWVVASVGIAWATTIAALLATLIALKNLLRASLPVVPKVSGKP